jgi:biopolymer transport protein TolR
MAAGPDSGDSGSISAINVTPLVDVMLVLLVIFMVTAQIMQQGINVDLPAASADPLPPETQAGAVIVTIDASGSVFLGEDPVDLISLVREVEAVLEEKPDKFVYVRGDREASYGSVARVMAALRRGGVARLGLMTEVGDEFTDDDLTKDVGDETG